MLQQDNEQSSVESRDSNKYQTGGMYFVLLIFIFQCKIVYLYQLSVSSLGLGFIQVLTQIGTLINFL